jgi:hypothetical protein
MPPTGPVFPYSTKSGMPVSSESNKNELKREAIREEHWPGSAAWIWDPASQKLKGFVGMSRLMPWITVLIRHLSKPGDPTGVYWEFWCRHMSRGIVIVTDEEECAFAAGYTSNRALRTWNEHVRKLTDLHFIDVKDVGLRKIGYVFLPNPLGVARYYHEQGRAPKGWWPSFKARAREIGADIPNALDPSLFASAPAKLDA